MYPRPGQWVSALRLLLEILGKIFTFFLGGKAGECEPRGYLAGSLWKGEKHKGKQSLEMDMDCHS